MRTERLLDHMARLDYEGTDFRKMEDEFDRERDIRTDLQARGMTEKEIQERIRGQRVHARRA